VHHGKRAFLPEGHERRHARVHPEETVQVDGAVLATRACHGDRRTQLVVLRLSVRDDHVEAVDRSALEDRDEQAAIRSGRRRGARQERRRKPQRHHRHRAGFRRDASWSP
jgi:hypothetical protein